MIHLIALLVFVVASVRLLYLAVLWPFRAYNKRCTHNEDVLECHAEENADNAAPARPPLDGPFSYEYAEKLSYSDCVKYIKEYIGLEPNRYYSGITQCRNLFPIIFEWRDTGPFSKTLVYKGVRYKDGSICTKFDFAIKLKLKFSVANGEERNNYFSFNTLGFGSVGISYPCGFGYAKFLFDISHHTGEIPDGTEILQFDYYPQAETEIKKAIEDERIAMIENARREEIQREKSILIERNRRQEIQKIAQKELEDEGVIFSEAAKRPHIPQNVVDAVWRRDGGKCVYCGSAENLQLDHIIPFSKGGATSVENLQILCQKCNLEKSNRIG